MVFRLGFGSLGCLVKCKKLTRLITQIPNLPNLPAYVESRPPNPTHFVMALQWGFSALALKGGNINQTILYLDRLTAHGLWPAYYDNTISNFDGEKIQVSTVFGKDLEVCRRFREMFEMWWPNILVPFNAHEQAFFKFHMYEWARHGVYGGIHIEDLSAYFSITLAIYNRFNIFEILRRRGIIPGYYYYPRDIKIAIEEGIQQIEICHAQLTNFEKVMAARAILSGQGPPGIYKKDVVINCKGGYFKEVWLGVDLDLMSPVSLRGPYEPKKVFYPGLINHGDDIVGWLQHSAVINHGGDTFSAYLGGIAPSESEILEMRDLVVMGVQLEKETMETEIEESAWYCNI